MTQLLQLCQDGMYLESYAEDIFKECSLVSWNYHDFNHLFLSGLDDELLTLLMLPKEDEYSLVDFINRVLQAMGSEFWVGEGDGSRYGSHLIPAVNGGAVLPHPESMP